MAYTPAYILKTGGPAFPNVDDGQLNWSGMDLRDWFAGQALAGLLAVNDPERGDQVQIAYDYADAMLVERKRFPEAP